MNELIAKLYDQAIVIEDGKNYVCGELDPVKFAELIITECIGCLKPLSRNHSMVGAAQDTIREHFDF
jgi:hypothetical protein